MSSAPQLHLVIALEGPVQARLCSWGSGEDLRLLSDLERRRRDDVVRELASAYDEAIEVLRRRADSSVPADVGFATGEGDQ
jgi:hypothetical protein